jgi:hypothetical protein
MITISRFFGGVRGEGMSVGAQCTDTEEKSTKDLVEE